LRIWVRSVSFVAQSDLARGDATSCEAFWSTLRV
jgi:hypothetical protein